MPFLTEVHFQNYRSFLDAKCRLSPVTVVIGANNAGKSNFLRGVGLTAKSAEGCLALNDMENSEVQNLSDEELLERPSMITVSSDAGELEVCCNLKDEESYPGLGNGWLMLNNKTFASFRAGLYAIDPDAVGIPGRGKPSPEVTAKGGGVTSVLLHLRENCPEQFQSLLADFRVFIPEVEELAIRQTGSKNLEVLWELYTQETGRIRQQPASQLSPGARATLAILTILYQPNRPELILIEDIEHAIHPRGLKPLVETMRRISKEHGVQIIFTTQSPYVLDAFQDPEHWDSVVIVEKRDGVSTLTNAKERLVALGYEREMDKVPLGDLWYSGLLGGVAGPNELWDEKEPKTTST